MPMYYPDLESVKEFAKCMNQHKDSKKYLGVIPETEDELPEARKQLGNYMRKVWGDEIAALEVELALNQDNYHEKLREHIAASFMVNKSFSL